MALSARHFPVLVTGAGGLLGRALGRRLQVLVAQTPPSGLVVQMPSSGQPHSRGRLCHGALRLTDLEELDVTDGRAVAAAVRDLSPRTIFHLAAWTDVDGAEAHPDEARRVNVEATEHVARAAAEAGALVVYISTDFVFDGAKPGLYVEEYPVNPLSVYGRTKYEGEVRVRTVAPASHLVVRTAWLYGAGRARSFIDVILAAARQGRPLRVVTDQVGCPTWAEDLADALVALVEADARGTFHACGAGEASRWDLAVEALRAAGLDAPVERITSAEMPRPAPRPGRAVLSTGKLARATGFRFPPWQESVRAYVASLEK
jgi:dTDP-4-dehydrorhamnose reductase